MILWQSVIGSHMWGRNHGGSDLDIVEVYVADYRDILLGKMFKGKFTKDAGDSDLFPELERTHVEVTRIEIGHLIGLLKKGNINALWMVLSPMTTGGFFLERLKKIVMDNLSIKTWHSVRGMIKNTVRLMNGKELAEKQHRYQMISRTLDQFNHLLDTGEIKWDFPLKVEPDMKMVEEIDDRIDGGNFSIKENIDTTEFDNYLINTRLHFIRKAMNGHEGKNTNMTRR